MVIATDLEGVLIPEIWVEIAEKTGIDELHLTTREEPDFEKLMHRRVEILRRHGIGLPDLQRIAAGVLPFPGSMEILAWLRSRGQVMIISDTFHEFADPIVDRLGRYNLHANRFRTNGSGSIEGFHLRIRGRKVHITEAFRGLGYTVVAVGDSSNDLSMLQAATHPILFHPTADLRKALPDAACATNYVELKNIVEKVPADE